MIDIARRHRMIEAFKATHGEEAAMTLAESLYSTDHATKADLEPLATKADLKALETRIDNCATKADLERFATKADLTALETRLEGRIDACATKADLATMEERLGRELGDMLNRHLWRFILVIVALIAATAAQQIFG